MHLHRAWIAVCVAWLAACGDNADSVASPPQHMLTGEECFEVLEEPGRRFIEIQRFEAADDSLEIWRARQPGERSSVGETFPYDLIAVWIDSELEDGTCVTDRAAMSYEFVHHNWDDTWTVETEHATYTGRETLNIMVGAVSSWTDTLEAKDDGEATLFTVELVDRGCESLPYDLNPCQARMRLDSPPEGWGEE